MPASAIAARHLGRPLPNAALLGAFAALAGLITLQAVEQAVAGRPDLILGIGRVTLARLEAAGLPVPRRTDRHLSYSCDARR